MVTGKQFIVFDVETRTTLGRFEELPEAIKFVEGCEGDLYEVYSCGRLLFVYIRDKPYSETMH